ncbi:MAG TPA: Stk1 family PASTA domain-containing Ser/Thr kinase [Symbiobacteriaceae bacterium]|nr:Stk1 family PASTA domain-containing Ser/Thr kinase [Symbiobacteriaceae bacterium]
MIGKVLANRYRMGERIGGGGMSLVYRARDLQLDRDVAVKVLRGQFGTDEEFVRRFKREAQNVASLSHPNIVQIYDVGQEQEQYFIVMELVEGQTLKGLINSQGPLPIADSVRIAGDILSALAHAHANRIVHRDIKPHNILMTRDGRAKVADFGIARATTTDTVTHTGSIMGSAHYFSPEQANGQPTGEKSDIYSVGIVLYEMVTGGVPFQGDSPITVALKHIRDRVVPPSQLNSEVPVELNEIILKALEKDPEDRYPTANTMRAALEEFGELHAAGETHLASGDFPTMDLRAMRGRKGRRLADDEEPDDEDWEPEPKKPGRTWLWISAVALVVLALVGGGAWMLVNLLEVPEVKVPDVVGMPLQQAAAELKKAQLTWEPGGSQYSTEVPAEGVLKTEPKADTPVKVGRAIVLTLSKGPNQKRLPDVRGRTQDEAKNLLENEQFKVAAEVTFQYDPRPSGTVIDTTPGPETIQTVGTTIKLTVSSGPLVVPEIYNLSLADAQKKITAVGLRVGKVDYLADPTRPKDTVLSSDPPQGQPVLPGTVVNLTLAQGALTGGTPFSKDLVVPGEEGRWYDFKVELYDVVTGIPNTSLLVSGQRKAGEKVNVKGQFFGQARLRVLVDNVEKQNIPLP